MVTYMNSWEKSMKNGLKHEIELGYYYATGMKAYKKRFKTGIEGEKIYVVTKTSTSQTFGKGLKVKQLSKTEYRDLDDALKKVQSLKTGKGWI